MIYNESMLNKILSILLNVIFITTIAALGYLYYSTNIEVKVNEQKLEDERKKLSDYVREQTLDNIESTDSNDTSELKFKSPENTYVLKLNEDKDFYYNLYKQNDKKDLELVESVYPDGFYIEGENVQSFIFDENENLYFTSKFVNAVTPGFDYVYLYRYDITDESHELHLIDSMKTTYSPAFVYNNLGELNTPIFIENYGDAGNEYTKLYTYDIETNKQIVLKEFTSDDSKITELKHVNNKVYWSDIATCKISQDLLNTITQDLPTETDISFDCLQNIFEYDIRDDNDKIMTVFKFVDMVKASDLIYKLSLKPEIIKKFDEDSKDKIYLYSLKEGKSYYFDLDEKVMMDN